VRLGKGSFENQELVADLATKLGLPTQNHEAGIIVGAASAIAQLEGGQQGIPVVVCLRRGDAEDIEFRTLSTAGDVLDEWRSVSAMNAFPEGRSSED
jgi:hypothetical protein